MIAWHLAMRHAERLRGLVILNAPHPATFVRELLRPSTQPLRSLHAFAFQAPWLPEAVLTAGRPALLDTMLRLGPARADGDVEPYRAAFADDEALAAGIDYYRAYVRHPPPPPRPVRVPTLVTWGMRDPFLVPRLLEGLDAWAAPLEIVRLADAGHWLHHTHADAVTAQVVRAHERCPP